MTNPDYEPLAVDIRCGNCRGHVLYHRPYWTCSSCGHQYTLRDINTYRLLVLEGEPSLAEKAANNAQLNSFSVILERPKKEKS